MSPMAQKKSWRQILQWKLIAAVILFPVVWFVSGAMDFPTTYRLMFVFYVFLGTGIFILLDAPLPEAPVGKGGIIFVIFFAVVAVIVTIIGHLWPQFSTARELEGITRKTERFRKDAEARESLSMKTKELSAKVDELMARLEELKTQGNLNMAALNLPEEKTAAPKSSSANLAPGDLVGRGKLVYQDQECYNCHKIGGKGGKKRGPELDNIGNLATAEQLKKKIFKPKAWYADGYEKRTKDKMPDKFPDVMSDDELEALVTYLMTLKNTDVKTPKPVFPSGS